MPPRVIPCFFAISHLNIPATFANPIAITSRATATMSSFGSSGRPAHVTSLSGKVQGLKFMQRANAATAAASPSSASSSPSTKKASPSTPAKDDSTTANTKTGDASSSSSKARGTTTTAKPRIVTLDGNEEHWGFAETPAFVSSSAVASAAEEEAPAQGWNQLLLASSSSSSSRRKGKETSRSTSAGDGNEAPTSAAGGRRKFGKFRAEKLLEEAEEEKRAAREAASGSKGKRRRQGGDDEGVLEPDFEFGESKARKVKGAESMRDRAKREGKGAGEKSKKARRSVGDEVSVCSEDGDQTR